MEIWLPSRFSPWAAGLALAFCLAGAALQAQEAPKPEAAAVPPEAAPVTGSGSTETDNSEAAADADAASERTTLNLLGQVDSSSGEARRNENVSLTLIDNNVLKELNTRMGTTATVVPQFEIERNYFGKEYGGSAAAPLHLPKASVSGRHGEFYWTHGNSIFSARSFFQVGGVKPSRSNDFGAAFSAPLWRGASLSLTAGQGKLQGQVNGNILVPAANERTPTTTDPATLAIVRRLIGAYPAELPNRTDINPRALNTNSPQNIVDRRLGATLDQAAGGNDRLVMRYNLTTQNVEAFQLVGGQNPDTTTKSHDARLTWNRALSAATILDFSAGFNRVGSLIVTEETALPNDFLFQRILETVGPGSNIPLDRAQNIFRYAARARHIRGPHALTAGFDLARRQVNGSESNDHRGVFVFRRDFGRDLIENLLAGIPSTYRRGIGNAHRGFRNWSPLFYLGDEWKAAANLTLTFGLRYEMAARPTEINGLTEAPYGCDCNNFAPSFGFAYKVNDRWGVLRGAYGLQYGEIFAATYMQNRFNPPGIVNLNLNAPNLVDPMRGISVSNLAATARSDYFRIDPELATPYSHQYNFSWELRPVRDWVLDLGYVGSRSHKLLSAWYTNRARQVPGLAPTTANINDRRPDARYSDVLFTSNASRGYFDAAKVTLRVPRWAGLSVETSYWWSKAIDLGGDYTNTAVGRDARQNRSPTENFVHERMRSVSNFDQPHALLLNAIYETPGAAALGPLGKIFGSWQAAAVVLVKSGTPFTVESGSDTPGVGNVDGVADDRPHIVDPSILGRAIDHPDTAAALLPVSAFRFASPFEDAGNLGRNTFRKDGIGNINASLSRRFALRGDMSLLFRAESLNFFNHPQFQEPGSSVSEGNFAQITNTLNDGRTFRFHLRLAF
jgi:hypothetical protein